MTLSATSPRVWQPAREQAARTRRSPSERHRSSAPAPGLIALESRPGTHEGLVALSAAALGVALFVNYGQYHPLALAALTASVLACVFSLVKPRTERSRFPAVGIALAMQFAILLTSNPCATLHPSKLTPVHLGVGCAAVFTLIGITSRRYRTASIVLLLFAHVVTGLWILKSAPQPGVDVCVFQRDACTALLNGINPYTLTFPDVYSPAAALYAPELRAGGRLLFGYPYPPLALLLALPGHLLGDFRLAQLAAMTLAGALMAFARPGRLAVAAAALFLFTPRGYFVLEAGWTEPFAILMLAAVVFIAARFPRSMWTLAVSMGLLLAVKQYLVFALPAIVLLDPHRKEGEDAPRRTSLKRLLIALGVAATITLPMALWNTKAFVHSVVTLQLHQPFRDDALSYLAWLSKLTGAEAPSWIALAAALPAILFVRRRCPATPSGFAAALGMIFLVFFAFNKQAFCNYYLFVIAALCCALAVAEPVPKPAPVSLGRPPAT